MEHIKFETGVREYIINNDKNCVIRFSPTDIGLTFRIKETIKKIDEIMKNTGESPEERVRADKDVRSLIDYLFDAKISDKIFGTTNCLSYSGGQMIVINFLEAVLPVVQKEAKEQIRLANERIKKYVSQIPEDVEGVCE